jgi:carboxypeptidase D
MYLTWSSLRSTDIANYIYDNPTALNLDLQGIWLGNRTLSLPSLSSPSHLPTTAALSWDVMTMMMPTLGFVQRYQSVFGFDDAFMAKLSAVSDKCGYTSYSANHVKYPPTAGALPLPGHDVEFDAGCDIWDMVVDQALLLNPAFNIYRIFDVVRPPLHPIP